MKSKQYKKTCFNKSDILIKILIVMVSSGFFVVLMGDVWLRFDSKMTRTGSRFIYDTKSEKKLPCLTLCPMRGFKSNKGAEGDNYQIEDIFSPETSANLRNKSRFVVKGFCFVLSSQTLDEGKIQQKCKAQDHFINASKKLL